MKRGYTVTVTMTPRQAIEATDALHQMAIMRESSRLFSASSRIVYGLHDAGWESSNVGTEDDPIWVWAEKATTPSEPGGKAW